MSIARYYGWLSRFQDVAHSVRHDAGRGTLTVHRHLRGDDGRVGGDVLHDVIVEAIAATTGRDATSRPLDVLDAGCGLGGTLLFLHAALGTRGVGITLSPDQQARAAAAARGVDAEVRFVVRDYDDDLRDLVPGGVDLIIAIESLAHAPTPAETIGRLATHLRPGGRLLLVDDVPADALRDDDRDFAAFRAGWLCPAIARHGALRQALDAAALSVRLDLDLTPRVPRRRRRALEARVLAARLASAAVSRTAAQPLVGALHGGLMLERLYRRGEMHYRLVVAQRGATAGG